MSKSLNTFAPILLLGGVAGVAFAVFSGNAKQGAIDAAQARIDAAVVEADAARSTMDDLTLQISDLASAPVPVLMGDPAPDTVSVALGRPALPEEVAAWDIDIRPDGAGLPEGSGDVWTGEEVFAENCASCHGDFGEAVGRWPVLAGGHDTLDEDDPVKTIGSYWPYLSTVYDYVNRAMPFGYAQSLEPDDVYAITAYLLYLNDLVDDDFELSHENFAEIRLPNEGNFYPDDRASTEYALFSAEPCMSDCKDAVEITARARIIDVTPEEDETGVSLASATAAGDTNALIADGHKTFRKPSARQTLGTGASHGTSRTQHALLCRPTSRAAGPTPPHSPHSPRTAHRRSI